MEERKLFLIVKLLALVGIFLAAYLLWQQVFRPPFQPCSINSTINCDAIISGEVSKTLRLPTPLYGLVGYTVIFFAAMFRKTRLLFGVAIFGLTFCMWIAYREVFELHVICPICILCQLVMTTVFGISVILFRRRDSE